MARENGGDSISCSELWMVFGERAAREFATIKSASNDQNAEEIAAKLTGRGFIPAVQNVAFDVRDGELFVIMGLSGSGKSTLVRCLSRLQEPTAGSVVIDGEDILAASTKRLTELRREKLGMVFQHFGLFPHLTVMGNVAFPLKMQGMSVNERKSRALEVLELVGLGGREDSYPRELSGGQRQRVGIARSLAVNPDIWFLDEPFSALDPLIRRQLQDEFLELQRRLRKSIVFITHDIAEALKLADRIAIMRNGQFVQIGTPTDIVLNPVDSYVREFALDVAKGRHATVSSVMHEVSVEGVDADPEKCLNCDMTLDDALAACCVGYEPVPVKDGNGKIVGIVHPKDLASAVQIEAA